MLEQRIIFAHYAGPHRIDGPIHLQTQHAINYGFVVPDLGPRFEFPADVSSYDMLELNVSLSLYEPALEWHWWSTALRFNLLL